MNDELDSAVRDLLAKQQIHEVLMRYCRAVDRDDMSLFESTYWPEAWDDHGIFKGTARELLALNRSGAGVDIMKIRYMHHCICNEYVTVEGDVAHAESYFVGHHGCEKEGVRQVYVLGGRYLDRFERRHGEWRIADRVVACDWESMAPETAGFWWPSPWVPGLHSTADVVYERWPSAG
jgi:SnoaL-like protein